MSSISYSTWTHVAIVFDGTNARFYKNGNLDTTVSMAATLASRSNPLRIGSDITPAQFHKGMIDELRVYSKALSQSEVQADMNTPITQQGYSVRVKIDMEGSVTDAADAKLMILNASNNATIAEINFTSNSTGDYLASLSGIPAVVNMKINVSGFLVRAVSNVDLASATTIAFPSLLAGDLDGNNVVNSLDFSAMNTEWYTNDQIADLNKDGLVNTLDYSLLNGNWQRSGE